MIKRPRGRFFWVFCALGLPVLAVGSARADSPSDWKVTTPSNGTMVMTHNTGNAMIIVGGKQAPADQIDVQIRVMAAAIPQCGATPATPILNGKIGKTRELVADAAGVRCRIVSAHKDGYVMLIFGMEPVAGPEDADPMIDRLATGLFGAPAVAATTTVGRLPAPSPNLAPSPVTAQPKPAGALSLQAAIDRIPKDRRPIGLVYSEGPWDSYKMQVTFVPHLLFPNGIAISPDCTSWDPAKPIAKQSAMGCSYDRYTLEGRTAYFSGDHESIDDYQGFKKGERLSINFSTVGGLANNGLNAGSNATWGGALTMTPQGKIQVASWSGATVSGAGFGAYGGSQKQGISGDYYLDGYLIGVQDARGAVGVTFIWQQNGQYVFLNGQQYNR
jgi:hypothetical protein